LIHLHPAAAKTSAHPAPAVTDQWWGYFNDPVLEITLL
jgi:hypothetical protein